MKHITDVALTNEFKKAEKEGVRELARKHTKEAIGTLVRLMKAPKTPPGVKRACAADILSQGWGRPDSRADSGGVSAQARGLTINILKLSTGTVESVTHKGEEMMQVVEALDVAKVIEEGVKAAKV